MYAVFFPPVAMSFRSFMSSFVCFDVARRDGTSARNVGDHTATGTKKNNNIQYEEVKLVHFYIRAV